LSNDFFCVGEMGGEGGDLSVEGVEVLVTCLDGGGVGGERLVVGGS